MSEKLPSPTSTAYIKEFLALFAHELRSPLSVLSNDIAYLSVKFQAEDLSNSKDAIKRMSEILASVDTSSTTTTEHGTCTIADIFAESSSAVDFGTNEFDRSTTFPFDLKSIKPYLTTLVTQIDSQAIRAQGNQHGLELSLAAALIHPGAGSIFKTLRFPLKAAASPTKLALAELFLTMNGILITAEAERLIVFLPYDSPKDPDSR